MKASIHDERAVESLRRELRLDPHQVRRFRYAFYQMGKPVPAALEQLPATARSEFERRFDFHDLQLQTRLDSRDGSTRLIYRTRSGMALDSVVLRSPAGKRSSLCVSSQIGCAANCSFCATAQLPQVRNLTVGEIVDQVLQANLALQHDVSTGAPVPRRVQNLVFMGMGEPFHNEENVVQAAEILFSHRFFNMSARRTVVSTVGIPDGMIRWATRFPRSPIALSLHSARQDIRESLIPLARRFPLPELYDAIREVTRIQNGPALIEYLLMDGVNNSPDDADCLAEYLRGLQVVINLIPLNPVEHAPELVAPGITGGNAFAARLRSQGYVVTFRRSQGRDIDAACGQLLLRTAAK